MRALRTIVRALLGAASLCLTMPANAVSGEGQIRAAADRCKYETSDKRLDILRGKLVLWDEDNTPAMLALERKVTREESAALRLLYDIRVRCYTRFQQLLNPGLVVQSPLQLNEGMHEQLSATTLLMNGYVTYAEYARSRDDRKAEQTKLNDEAMRKREQEAAEQANPTMVLSCDAETPPEFRGVEFQYRVDTRANAVYANRGPGPLSVHMNDSEISFRQENNQTSISRLTGLFSINGGYGMLITGRCSRATSKAF